MRGAKWMAGAAIVAGLLSGCAAQPVQQEKSGDSIRLVGHGDNFRCDDPAYETVNEVPTFTVYFIDGRAIQLCRPETPERPSPSQRGDLLLELSAREPKSENLGAVYRKAKREGNARDVWDVIGVAQSRDLALADRMWHDYWLTVVLPAFRDQHQVALRSLKSAAERGLRSAMARLAEAYRKGDFGLQVDEKLAADWVSKAAAAKAVSGERR